MEAFFILNVWGEWPEGFESVQFDTGYGCNRFANFQKHIFGRSSNACHAAGTPIHAPHMLAQYDPVRGQPRRERNLERVVFSLAGDGTNESK